MADDTLANPEPGQAGRQCATASLIPPFPKHPSAPFLPHALLLTDVCPAFTLVDSRVKKGGLKNDRSYFWHVRSPKELNNCTCRQLVHSRV